MFKIILQPSRLVDFSSSRSKQILNLKKHDNIIIPSLYTTSLQNVLSQHILKNKFEIIKSRFSTHPYIGNI